MNLVTSFFCSLRAKLKGYPFWPAKICELVFNQPQNESTPNLKTKAKRNANAILSNQPKEYRVLFYGYEGKSE